MFKKKKHFRDFLKKNLLETPVESDARVKKLLVNLLEFHQNSTKGVGKSRKTKGNKRRQLEVAFYQRA